MLIILRAAIILFAGSVSVSAQAPYPSRPITMVVAFAPGGSTDLIARVVAQQISATLGQPVLVDNKGGADGAVGTQFVVRAAPDGYTIIMSTTSTHVINPLLIKNTSYDPIKDFQPVSLVAKSPNILVTNDKFGAATLKDVIDRAKASPGKLNAGVGASMHQLNGALFRNMANVSWVDVPYKGTAPALNDLMGGQIDLMFDQLPSSMALIEGGRIKAIAVTSGQRSPLVPNIPTMQESGLPQFESSSWWGVLAPAKTPADIVAKINAAITKALTDPQLLDSFKRLGLETWQSSPDEFAKLLVDERAKWQKVIADNKIEAN